MKKIKKVLSWVLALTFILTAAGCGGSAEYTNSPETPKTAGATPAATSAATAAATQAPAANAQTPQYSANDGVAAGERPSAQGEQYLEIVENRETLTEDNSMLTFSLKVDTSSYSNIERYIESGSLPPQDAVKIEEMLNYFNYETEMQFDGSPFSVYSEIGTSPFDSDKYLAFIRVKAKDIDRELLSGSNFTFLIDTSGSMNSYDKLPLLKSAFSLLVETLDERDTVSIVTYAGSSEIVIDSVRGDDKQTILNAINSLTSGGSTAGANGIITAYELAEKNFIDDGNNRIILASDGDFNVGVSSLEGLEKLVSDKRESGVYLSILGFGTGNIRDDIMETLSKNGNGNYAYIDSVHTARKTLVDELGSSLFTVADDVKAQVEFNADYVKNYRLIGYENRMLSEKDFNDDQKDAGEIGVGTDVVALFELELTDEVKAESELMEVRVRFKNPGEDESRVVVKPVTGGQIAAAPSADYSFACAVAAFGHLLRGSEYTGGATIQKVQALAQDGKGRDKEGYRQEFLSLLAKYDRLAG